MTGVHAESRTVPAPVSPPVGRLPALRSNRSLQLAGMSMVTALSIFTIWRYAWLSDDALITLRTSLNWAHGYGAVFNPDERVAGYTHPLWMALLTLLGAASGSWIVGTLVASVILAGIAVAILVFRSQPLAVRDYRKFRAVVEHTCQLGYLRA